MPPSNDWRVDTSANGTSSPRSWRSGPLCNLKATLAFCRVCPRRRDTLAIVPGMVASLGTPAIHKLLLVYCSPRLQRPWRVRICSLSAQSSVQTRSFVMFWTLSHTMLARFSCTVTPLQPFSPTLQSSTGFRIRSLEVGRPVGKGKSGELRTQALEPHHPSLTETACERWPNTNDGCSVTDCQSSQNFLYILLGFPTDDNLLTSAVFIVERLCHRGEEHISILFEKKTGFVVLGHYLKFISQPHSRAPHCLDLQQVCCHRLKSKIASWVQHQTKTTFEEPIWDALYLIRCLSG